MKTETLIKTLNYIAWILVALAVVSTVMLIESLGAMAFIVGISGVITSLLLFSLAKILEALDVTAHNSAILAEEVIKENAK